jgi:hypothetical protein
LSLALFLIWCSPTYADGQLTKAEISKRGKSATVFVKSTKGSGSGFCINPAGLLITNQHVVNDDKEVTVVFNPAIEGQKELRAKVLRSDKKLDLALLQVDGEKNLPVLPMGDTDNLAELADVIICGFPFGELLAAKKEYPAISINSGSVTALRRQAGVLDVIQLDAAVNPGNSGGPVIDMDGKVVGVVVASLRGGEQLNFAIPVGHVQSFVKRPEVLLKVPAITRSNAHQPTEFEARLVYVFPPVKMPSVELVLRSRDGDERRADMVLNDGVYRLTTIPLPKIDPVIVEILARYKTGAVLGTAEDREFLVGERKVKLSTCRQILSQPKPSVVLADGNVLEGAPTSLDKVPVTVAGQIVNLDLGAAASVQLELPEPVDNIDCLLIARQDEIEIGRSESRISLAATPARPGKSTIPQPVSILPPEIAGEMLVKKLPEIASDICVGGGGRYLILNLPKMKKLAVFDVNQSAIVRYIPLTDEQVVYAAGLKKIVIGVTAKGILERWDINTGQKEIVRPMPDLANVTSVIMGSASHNHVVANAIVFDLQTLKPMGVKTPRGAPTSSNPVSADGMVFGAWKTNQSPDESISFVFEAGELKRYEEGGLKHVVPGPDGRWVCTGKGVRTQQLKSWGGGVASAGYCLPATEGKFVLSIGSAEGAKGGNISLYLLDHDYPLVKDVGFTHSVHFDGWDRTTFGPWKRIFFIPRAELFVIFPESNDRLELHHFDLDGALENSGLDYLLVTSQPPTTVERGAEFKYQILVKSRVGDVKFHLSSGPEGMEVSPAGLLKWQVPAGATEMTTDVIISVTDGSGQELFHTFSLLLAAAD